MSPVQSSIVPLTMRTLRWRSVECRSMNCLRSFTFFDRYSDLNQPFLIVRVCKLLNWTFLRRLTFVEAVLFLGLLPLSVTVSSKTLSKNGWRFSIVSAESFLTEFQTCVRCSCVKLGIWMAKLAKFCVFSNPGQIASILIDVKICESFPFALVGGRRSIPTILMNVILLQLHNMRFKSLPSPESRVS